MARIIPPYYPIVYVRGYAMTDGEKEDNFFDTYYGFNATSVEKKQAPAPDYFKADVFEGQLIKFMKLKDHQYIDQCNSGIEDVSEPSRSLWVCRFYDRDYFDGKNRGIDKHAEELRDLILKQIPQRLENRVEPADGDKNIKVILIAHSMGGLVCRTLIQSILPGMGLNPNDYIHKFVTLGTPHGGIDVEAVPDFMEDFMAKVVNPYGSAIFRPEVIKKYLKLPGSYEPHSLGDPSDSFHFPVSKCFCIVGSNYQSYQVGGGYVKQFVGSFSDGLVKQSNAYVVQGPPPEKGKKYDEKNACYYANVHRAHSGRRGIVNSYESFENIKRFLFGNTKIDVTLTGLDVPKSDDPDYTFFYDFEFRFAIKNTGVYLHRREQEPCENAIRIDEAKLPDELKLHTFFMDTNLKAEGQPYSFCLITLRVNQRGVKTTGIKWPWDKSYPRKQIYCEDVEIGYALKEDGTKVIAYKWLSDGELIEKIVEGDFFSVPLRKSNVVKGSLTISASPWK